MIPGRSCRRIGSLNIAVAVLLATVTARADEAVSTNASQADAFLATDARAWAAVPEILARIKPPVFPDRRFLITGYGATGDGAADCTEAFRKAIDACSASGGGKVIVPPGIFLTGAIHLKSNVDLDLARGATIRFSTDRKKFLPPVFARYEGTEVMNYSPFIYALGQENIAITGQGTIDGQGAAWHDWKSFSDPRQLVALGDRGVPVAERKFGSGHHLRPNFIVPVRCKNVLIAGVRIVNSPMWVLQPLYCTNVTIRDVMVDTTGPNTDGCDPDSSTGVLIQDCNFSDGDDCIAIKSGRDVDGRRVNIPSRNIVIENCEFKDGHGGVTVGSETSGGVENVFAEHCRFDSPNLDMAVRLKTGMTRGGFIQSIHVRDCAVKIARVGIAMTMRYPGTLDGRAPPVIRDIAIRNCAFARLTRQPMVIEGYSEAVRITDVAIADCVFENTAKASVVTNASRVFLIRDRGSRLGESSRR
ncbi:MAG: glycoside hydrolase family 28 protein [Verrucomicrobiota bacterium]|nr:glycoside hydrolase family 28 protein [Verrucomicrobiota bacterium]